MRTTASVIEACPCAAGCPSCVQSPKCGNGNEPLDKAAARPCCARRCPERITVRHAWSHRSAASGRRACGRPAVGGSARRSGPRPAPGHPVPALADVDLQPLAGQRTGSHGGPPGGAGVGVDSSGPDRLLAAWVTRSWSRATTMACTKARSSRATNGSSGPARRWPAPVGPATRADPGHSEPVEVLDDGLEQPG